MVYVTELRQGIDRIDKLQADLINSAKRDIFEACHLRKDKFCFMIIQP